MNLASRRLSGVRRAFDPFVDRRGLVRLDRNEDPDGWDSEHFSRWIASLGPHDLAAYSDSAVLTRRIADWQSLSDEQVVVTQGSDGAVKLIFETYLDPGDVVVTLDPSWRMYDVWAAAYQSKVIGIPYSDDLTIEAESVCVAIEVERPRIVVIANPNQPTGTILSNESLERIAQVCASTGSLLVVDEAYYLFTEVTATELLSKFKELIIVRTFSKAFGLAGLRIGYCLSSSERVEELRLLRPVADASSLAISAALFSLDNIEWVRNRILSVVEGREYLSKKLVELDALTFPSSANFVLVGCESDVGARECVEKCRAHGFTIKGPLAVGPIPSMIRISVGSEETMMAFWERCGSDISQFFKRSTN